MKDRAGSPLVVSGVRVELSGLEAAVGNLVAEARGMASAQSRRFLNAHSFSSAHRDGRYRQLLTGDGVNLPDGISLILAARLLGHRGKLVQRQVRGPDFFTASLSAGVEHGVRHYFLGATDATLKRLAAEVRRLVPEVSIVGQWAPPFRPLSADELAAQDRAIVDSNADVVWVGLGAPKQDFESQRLTASLGIPAVGVGAAFDFVAGTKRAAPRAVSRIGLEWLFRLATEPRRLWRRYLFGNSRFVMIVLKERWRDVRASRRSA